MEKVRRRLRHKLKMKFALETSTSIIAQNLRVLISMNQTVVMMVYINDNRHVLKWKNGDDVDKVIDDFENLVIASRIAE